MKLFTLLARNDQKGKADFNKDGFIKTIGLGNYVDDEVFQPLRRKFFKRPSIRSYRQADTRFRWLCIRRKPDLSFSSILQVDI